MFSSDRILCIDQEKGRWTVVAKSIGERNVPFFGSCPGSFALERPPLAEQGWGSRGPGGHAHPGPTASLCPDQTPGTQLPIILAYVANCVVAVLTQTPSLS